MVACLRWLYHHKLLISHTNTHTHAHTHTHTYIYMYVYIYIYIYPWKVGFCVSNYCAVLWCAQIMEHIIAWWPVVAVICTLNYLIIIIIDHHWSCIIIRTFLKFLNCSNACLLDYVSCVCLRLGQFSQLSFMQYMGLCVLRLHISLIMIYKIPVLGCIIIIKSEVWPICHCLGLGHETMVCEVCLSIFV